jgi:hypothetical protein
MQEAKEGADGGASGCNAPGSQLLAERGRKTVQVGDGQQGQRTPPLPEVQEKTLDVAPLQSERAGTDASITRPMIAVLRQELIEGPPRFRSPLRSSDSAAAQCNRPGMQSQPFQGLNPWVLLRDLGPPCAGIE